MDIWSEVASHPPPLSPVEGLLQESCCTVGGNVLYVMDACVTGWEKSLSVCAHTSGVHTVQVFRLTWAQCRFEKTCCWCIWWSSRKQSSWYLERRPNLAERLFVCLWAHVRVCLGMSTVRVGACVCIFIFVENHKCSVLMHFAICFFMKILCSR